MSTLGGGLAAPPPSGVSSSSRRRVAQHSGDTASASAFTESQAPAPVSAESPQTAHDKNNHDDSNPLSSWMAEDGAASVVASAVVTSLSHWKIILFGQVLAVLMGLRGSSTALLYLTCGVMAPTFQMACVYFLMSFHIIGLACRQRSDRHRSASAKLHTDVFQSNPHRPSSNLNDDDDEDVNSAVLNHNRNDNMNAAATTAQRRMNAMISAAAKAQDNDTTNGERNSSTTAAPVIDMSFVYQKENLDREEEDAATRARYQYKIPGCRHNIFLESPWYRYLVLALLDVEGNVLTCMALKYTSIQSVSLLDTLAIPAAMLSSYLLLHKRYSPWHLLGATVCVTGASIMVLSDYEKAVEDSTSDPYYSSNNDGAINNDTENAAANQGEGVEYQYAVFGDILASLGGICFGLRDTLSEETLQVSSRTEYLGMVGLYGLMLSTIQIILFEKELMWQLFEASLCGPDATFGMFAAIVLIFAAYYIGTAQFLNVSEAALLNLNLLTSDLYAIMFSIIEEHTLPNQLCGLSMFLILTGVLVYESVPPPAEDLYGQHVPSAFGPNAYSVQSQSANSLRLGQEDNNNNQGSASKKGSRGTNTAPSTIRDIELT